MKNRDIFYKLFSPIVSMLFYIIFLPKVKGKENIPKKKGAILAGNHKSNLDCFMVILSTRRSVHFLAKAELFKLSFLNWFFRNSGLIPVYRNGKDKKALEAAIEYLENNKLVGVFPEGRLNKKLRTTVLPFKIGAVKMAKETGKPIIPFTIKGRYIPFAHSIEINFQRPFYVTDNNLDEANKILERKVCKPLNERKKK
jgi:1-acyl-sn-glycerol-3-phosphate acyltransferase